MVELQAVGHEGLPGPCQMIPLEGPLTPPSGKVALKLKGLYLPVSFLSHMSHLFSCAQLQNPYFHLKQYTHLCVCFVCT